MTRRTALTIDSTLDLRLAGFKVTSGELVLQPSDNLVTSAQYNPAAHECYKGNPGAPSRSAMKATAAPTVAVATQLALTCLVRWRCSHWIAAPAAVSSASQAFSSTCVESREKWQGRGAQRNSVRLVRNRSSWSTAMALRNKRPEV